MSDQDLPPNGGTTFQDVEDIMESDNTTAEESVRAWWEYLSNL